MLISAGFDAHRDDPLADCRLEASSFAEMARHVRDFAEELACLSERCSRAATNQLRWRSACCETLTALSGDEPPRSAAPEALLTSRAAAHVGHYWPL